MDNNLNSLFKELNKFKATTAKKGSFILWIDYSKDTPEFKAFKVTSHPIKGWSNQSNYKFEGGWQIIQELNEGSSDSAKPRKVLNLSLENEGFWLIQEESERPNFTQLRSIVEQSPITPLQRKLFHGLRTVDVLPSPEHQSTPAIKPDLRSDFRDADTEELKEYLGPSVIRCLDMATNVLMTKWDLLATEAESLRISSPNISKDDFEGQFYSRTESFLEETTQLAERILSIENQLKAAMNNPDNGTDLRKELTSLMVNRCQAETASRVSINRIYETDVNSTSEILANKGMSDIDKINICLDKAFEKSQSAQIFIDNLLFQADKLEAFMNMKQTLTKKDIFKEIDIARSIFNHQFTIMETALIALNRQRSVLTTSKEFMNNLPESSGQGDSLRIELLESRASQAEKKLKEEEKKSISLARSLEETRKELKETEEATGSLLENAAEIQKNNQEEIENLETSVEELQGKLRESTESNRRISVDNDNKNSEHAEEILRLRTEIDNIKTAYNKAVFEKGKLELDLQRTSSDTINSLQDEICEIKKENESLAEEIDRLRATNDRHLKGRKSIDQAQEALKEVNEQLSEDVKKKETLLNTLHTNLSRAKSEAFEAKQCLKELQERNEEQVRSEEFKNLSNELAAKVEELDQKERLIKKFEKEAIEREATEEERVNDLNDQIRELFQNKRDTSVHTKELQDQISDLQGLLSCSRQEKQKLDNQLQSIKEEKKNLQEILKENENLVERISNEAEEKETEKVAALSHSLQTIMTMRDHAKEAEKQLSALEIKAAEKFDELEKKFEQTEIERTREIAELLNKLSQAEKKLEEQEANRTEVFHGHVQIEQAMQENNKLQEEVARFRSIGTVEGIIKLIDGLKKNNTELAQFGETLKKEIKDLKTPVDKEEESSARKYAVMEEQYTRCESARSELTNKVKELNGDKFKLREEVTHLKNSLASALERVKEFHESSFDATETSKKLKEVESALNLKQKELNDLKASQTEDSDDQYVSTIETLTQSLKTLQESVKNKDATISALRRSSGADDDRVKKLEATNLKQQHAINALNLLIRKGGSEDGEVEKLQNSLAESQKEVSNLRDRIFEIQDKNTKETNEVKQLKSTINENNKTLTDLNISLINTQRERDNKDEELKKIGKRHDEEMAALQKEKQKWDEEISTIQKEKKELSKQVASARTEANELKIETKSLNAVLDSVIEATEPTSNLSIELMKQELARLQEKQEVLSPSQDPEILSIQRQLDAFEKKVENKEMAGMKNKLPAFGKKMVKTEAVPPPENPEISILRERLAKIEAKQEVLKAENVEFDEEEAQKIEDEEDDLAFKILENKIVLNKGGSHGDSDHGSHKEERSALAELSVARRYRGQWQELSLKEDEIPFLAKDALSYFVKNGSLKPGGTTYKDALKRLSDLGDKLSYYKSLCTTRELVEALQKELVRIDKDSKRLERTRDAVEEEAAKRNITTAKNLLDVKSLADPPKFNGSIEPCHVYEWMNELKNICSMRGIPDYQRKDLMLQALSDNLKSDYRGSDYAARSYEEIIAEIRKRFGNTNVLLKQVEDAHSAVGPIPEDNGASSNQSIIKKAAEHVRLARKVEIILDYHPDALERYSQYNLMLLAILPKLDQREFRIDSFHEGDGIRSQDRFYELLGVLNKIKNDGWSRSTLPQPLGRKDKPYTSRPRFDTEKMKKEKKSRGNESYNVKESSYTYNTATIPVEKSTVPKRENKQTRPQQDKDRYGDQGHQQQKGHQQSFQKETQSQQSHQQSFQKGNRNGQRNFGKNGPRLSGGNLAQYERNKRVSNLHAYEWKEADGKECKICNLKGPKPDINPQVPKDNKLHGFAGGFLDVGSCPWIRNIKAPMKMQLVRSLNLCSICLYNEISPTHTEESCFFKNRKLFKERFKCVSELCQKRAELCPKHRDLNEGKQGAVTREFEKRNLSYTWHVEVKEGQGEATYQGETRTPEEIKEFLAKAPTFKSKEIKNNKAELIEGLKSEGCVVHEQREGRGMYVTDKIKGRRGRDVTGMYDLGSSDTLVHPDYVGDLVDAGWIEENPFVTLTGIGGDQPARRVGLALPVKGEGSKGRVYITALATYNLPVLRQPDLRQESVLLKEACSANGFTIDGPLHYSEPETQCGLLIGARNMDLFPKEVFRHCNGALIFKSNFLSSASDNGYDAYCMGGNANLYPDLVRRFSKEGADQLVNEAEARQQTEMVQHWHDKDPLIDPRDMPVSATQMSCLRTVDPQNFPADESLDNQTYIAELEELMRDGTWDGNEELWNHAFEAAYSCASKEEMNNLPYSQTFSSDLKVSPKLADPACKDL